MNIAVRGFGLVEVLVAMLVIATGVLGLSATMLLAHRTQQAAVVRTQVAWLAADLIERLRLNPVAAAQGAYDADYPVAPGGRACDATRACSPAALAAHDRARWSALLRVHLSEAAHASLACRRAQVGAIAPGDGLCDLAIAWRSRAAEARTTRMAWTFRP